MLVANKKSVCHSELTEMEDAGENSFAILNYAFSIMNSALSFVSGF